MRWASIFVFDGAIRSARPVEKVNFFDVMCGSDCSIEKVGIEKALFRLRKDARFGLRSEIALFDPPIRLRKKCPKSKSKGYFGFCTLLYGSLLGYETASTGSFDACAVIYQFTLFLLNPNLYSLAINSAVTTACSTASVP